MWGECRRRAISSNFFFILGGSFSGDYRRSFYFANFVSLSKGLFGPETGFVLCDIGLEFD